MDAQPRPKDKLPDISNDILIGADEIAKFLFGPSASRRKVYYLASHTRIPLFRMGSVLCARRSVLLNWISGQENLVRPGSTANSSR
jgi:hypothetical protein